MSAAVAFSVSFGMPGIQHAAIASRAPAFAPVQGAARGSRFE